MEKIKITDKDGKEVTIWTDWEVNKILTEGNFATEEQREAWANSNKIGRP